MFSLTCVFVPQKKQNLAAFISVGADAADPRRYGKFQILRLPDNTQVPGPSQIANQFSNDPEIAEALRAFKQTDAKVVYGNLLTLPVGGGLLYVQPLYTLREGGTGNYPALQFVLVSFGHEGRHRPDAAGSARRRPRGQRPGDHAAHERGEPPGHRDHDAVADRRVAAAAAGRREVPRGRCRAEEGRPAGLRHRGEPGPRAGRAGAGVGEEEVVSRLVAARRRHRLRSGSRTSAGRSASRRWCGPTRRRTRPCTRTTSRPSGPRRRGGSARR